MRRLILTLATLSLVAPDAIAQRRGGRPPVDFRRPDQPAEKPPLMPGLTDPRHYTRYQFSRFSLEQYPMLSHMTTTGFVSPGIPTSYMTLGDGTQLSFRAAPSLSLTADLTSAVFGGPFTMGTAEFGVRVKPWASLRFTPFIDARTSYAYTSGAGQTFGLVPVLLIYETARRDLSTGSGSGQLFGVGVDTRLRTRWALNTTLSATRYAMHGADMRSAREWDYTTTTTRLTVGLRYNHGRWLDAPR